MSMQALRASRMGRAALERSLLGRLRQHTNPLAVSVARRVPPPPWAALFDRLDRPVHLDIGCAKGHWVVDQARRRPDWNFVGVDVRSPVLRQARALAAESRLSNAAFVRANLQYTASTVLASLPATSIACVTVLHPDPWFKARHKKRRVINEHFLALLAFYLGPGVPVHLQTDVPELFEDMLSVGRASPFFDLAGTGSAAHLRPPTAALWGVPTNREASVLASGGPIFRHLLLRNDAEAPHVPDDTVPLRGEHGGEAGSGDDDDEDELAGEQPWGPVRDAETDATAPPSSLIPASRWNEAVAEALAPALT